MTSGSFKGVRPLVEPIVTTTAYEFESFEHCRATYAAEIDSYGYSRVANPTIDYLEEKISHLLNGRKCVGFSSGMAAINALLFAVCNRESNILVSGELYGGTLALIDEYRRFGIDIRFVDLRNLGEVEEQLDDKTALLFAEPVSNPTMRTFDVHQVSELCHQRQVPFVLDTTNNVLEFDANGLADIQVVSGTKVLGGHGTALAGFLVFCSNLERSEKSYSHSRFAFLENPCAELGGRSPNEMGEKPDALYFYIRAKTRRNTGACLSPFNAHSIDIGLNTLPIRLRHINETARTIKALIENHRGAKRLHTVERTKEWPLVAKYFHGRPGGVFSFEVLGGEPGAAGFLDSLHHIPIATNIGDSRTIIQHVRTTSHSQLSSGQMKSYGIPPDLLRISVGLEDQSLIVKDISNALDLVASSYDD